MGKELHQHLGENQLLTSNGTAKKNYRNGYSKKSVKTDMGEVSVQVPETETATFLQIF